MYALGMIFLYMKFLLIESKRTPDIIKDKINLVIKEESMTSLIITTLLDQNPISRLNNSYESLSRMIE